MSSGATQKPLRVGRAGLSSPSSSAPASMHVGFSRGCCQASFTVPTKELREWGQAQMTPCHVHFAAGAGRFGPGSRLSASQQQRLRSSTPAPLACEHPRDLVLPLSWAGGQAKQTRPAPSLAVPTGISPEQQVTPEEVQSLCPVCGL